MRFLGKRAFCFGLICLGYKTLFSCICKCMMTLDKKKSGNIISTYVLQCFSPGNRNPDAVDFRCFPQSVWQCPCCYCIFQIQNLIISLYAHLMINSIYLYFVAHLSLMLIFMLLGDGWGNKICGTERGGSCLSEGPGDTSYSWWCSERSQWSFTSIGRI